MSNPTTGTRSLKEISITDLNEDCIHHLISYLDFRDKVSFILASDLLDYKIFADIDLSCLIKYFKMSEIKDFISRYGTHIQKLSYYPYRTSPHSLIEIMFYAVHYCPNIEEIDFKFFDDDFIYGLVESRFDNSQNLIAPFEQIQDLRLQDCALVDINLSGVLTLSRLKRLDLSYNSEITGKYLNNLKNLKYLNLTFCAKFDPENFIELCKANKLETLSILGCAKLNDSAIAALIETQNDLEAITFGRNEKPENSNICQLKNLKYLQAVSPLVGYECLNAFIEAIRFQNELLETVTYKGSYKCPDDQIPRKASEIRNLKRLLIDSDAVDDEVIKILAQTSSPIEELSITYATYVTGPVILELLANLQQLRIFSIRECPAVDTILFAEIVGVVKRRKSTVPLKINVCKTEIEPEFLESDEYLKSKDFVTMTFDNSYPDYNHNKYFGKIFQYDYGIDELIVLEKHVN